MLMRYLLGAAALAISGFLFAPPAHAGYCDMPWITDKAACEASRQQTLEARQDWDKCAAEWKGAQAIDGGDAVTEQCGTKP